MNAERLLQHFDRISEASDAIPCLRNFILSLAVRGKLVEQDPNDEPAIALLCELREAKERLQEEENIRGRQPVPRTESSELGFTVPDSWEFPAFDDVFVIVSGVTKGRNLAGSKTIELPYLRVANVQRGYLDLSVMKTIYIPEDELPRYALRPGDVLMTEGGDWDKLGRAAIWLGEIAPCIHQNHVFRVRSPLPERLHPKWVVTYTNSLLGRSYFENAAKQTTNLASINMTQLRGYPLPLPPLAEQHRIVAKVDELMALCDQLEAAKTEREKSRDRLVAASLHRLNFPADTAEADAPDLLARQADSFRDHARFVFNHLPRLTTRPEHIKQLRQTILNLAVLGKLIPQDPNDEPASELFNSTGHDGEKSAPFSLPNTWKWAKVQEIADTRLGKMLDRAKNKGTERRYLRNVNVRWFDFELSDILTMRFEERELEEFSLRVGDVLICEGGEPGRAAVWDEREKNIYFQKAIHRVRFAQGVNPHYFVYVIKESADSGRLAGYFTGIGIKHFTGKGLSSLLVPLPPLAEQHRIVARVDELMALCDQLEAQLTTTKADSRRLLEAMLHEALAPALEETV